MSVWGRDKEYSSEEKGGETPKRLYPTRNKKRCQCPYALDSRSAQSPGPFPGRRGPYAERRTLSPTEGRSLFSASTIPMTDTPPVGALKGEGCRVGDRGGKGPHSIFLKTIFLTF